MDELCITCLCSGRNMIYLNESELFQFYTQILNETVSDMTDMCNDIRVCWVCCAVMKRFQKFKVQAQNCYMEMLQHVQQNSLSKNLKRDSHLQIHHAHNFSIDYLNVLDTLKVEFETKEDDIALDDNVQNHEDDVHQDLDDTHHEADETVCDIGDTQKESDTNNDLETAVDIKLENKVKKKRKKVKLKKTKQNGKLKGKSKIKVKTPTSEKTDNTDVAVQDTLKDCKECTMKFELQEELEAHILAKHSVQNGVNEVSGVSVVNGVKRVRSKEALPERPQCDECGKMFSSRKTYRYHMNVLHKGQNTYPCPRCGKVYQWKSNLGRHLRTHRARDNDELHCGACDKTFASVATYRQHLRSSRRHVDETDYSFMCNECGKKFVNKTRLRDHIDWEHLHNIKFRCTVCNKPFKCHTSRYVHMQNVHASREKENLCHVCGKSYTNAAKLRYHIVAMHTSDTPYRCERCNAAFSWYSSLYRHVREVHYKMKVQPKKSRKNKKLLEEILPHPPLNPIPSITP